MTVHSCIDDSRIYLVQYCYKHNCYYKSSFADFTRFSYSASSVAYTFSSVLGVVSMVFI